MIIRRAMETDLNGVKNLLAQVLLTHHMGRPDLFKEKGQKYADAVLLEKFKDEENPIFVAIDEDGTVLGHCFCQTIINSETPATYTYKTLYIDDLCVDENVRGRSIGKALYEYVKSFARANEYYHVTLHAWECNPNAVGFYEHLGMRVQQYTFEELL